jgi:two-component system, cell cycle sensor histidine kinase and response regulator CckA
VIFGHSAVLARALILEDSLSESLAEINRAAERGAALTHQLLAFSRQQILAPKVLDLNAVLADTDKMLRRLIGEDVRLVTVLAPDLTPVRADPGKITQVIMNLAVNARDAMPKGGTLTLETRDVELAEADVEAQPGRYALLAVTDTGCGMTPEVQAHLFEPFFTTKTEGKGTGAWLGSRAWHRHTKWGSPRLSERTRRCHDVQRLLTGGARSGGKIGRRRFRTAISERRASGRRNDSIGRR